MCGRYTLTSTDGLVDEFELIMNLQPADQVPRYNIAPTHMVPIIANQPRNERVAESMRWGLIPSWAKDPAIGNRMINARCETAAEKPAFKQALRYRRCIVPADGFYEWQRRGKSKHPYFIHAKDTEPGGRSSRQLLGFGGLWERWKTPDGTWLLSFTILTTAANPFMAPLHDRMPVIIDAADYDRWLDPEPQSHEVFDDILAPCPADRLAMYEVSQLVNSPKNDASACIAPVVRQATLFDRV